MTYIDKDEFLKELKKLNDVGGMMTLIFNIIMPIIDKIPTIEIIETNRRPQKKR
ncbi:hypothetical protein [Ruminococcus sp.]|uniref:hypothetical protein n=1 Tax=Ruminococcus sp. TaxID=41978 RepID=UPI0026115002|nr:hypothetical protein [Ruminococcus sp.]MDD6990172.1 hypothetical protein [Ruminococcus sp.]MDY6202882.1 hypothetical protein [Ruminococcus sp.]